MSKSRRKHKDLTKAIAKIRSRAGGKYEKLARRFRKQANAPSQDSFAEVYLD